MAGRLLTSPTAILVLAILAAFIYTAELPRVITVLGIFRQKARTDIDERTDFRVIADTVHCEDVHHHEPSNLLFTACEGNSDTRYMWFPPIAQFADPTAALKAQGTLEVIDPQTMQAKRLKFTNFNGPFVTHGIDVIDDPDKPQGTAVYIFAVNHVPSPAYSEDQTTKESKSRSIVEVFHHEIGTDSVSHIRSVWHPLIRTPNDIVAVSPTSFFVTNDFYHREGFLRQVELCYIGAKWTDTVYVEFTETTDGAFRDGDHDVKASVAVEGLHNNNGLGHGPAETDIFISSSASGRLHLGEIAAPKDGKGPLFVRVKESIEFDTALDNPGWFRDPFAQQSGRDASGVVIAGFSRGIEVAGMITSPGASTGTMIWMATPAASSNATQGKADRWQKRVIFEDDGTRINVSTSAVLVAIDPAKEKGKRKAWLFVTGVVAKNMIAVKVDL